MENASKALLISAAVLIAILLISFGIRIFNSTDNTDDMVYGMGQEILSETKDASDMIDGYLIKRFPDTTVENPSNGYYINYFTKMELKENKKYIISFDYIIREKEKTDICCGIGIGTRGEYWYNRDLEYAIKYPSQELNTKKTFTFVLEPSKYSAYNENKDKKVYLSLRLARTGKPSKFKVDIQNITIKYKE